MREILGIVGIVAAIQGALGIVGRVVGDKPWGMLQQWFDVPTPGYVAIAAAGLALAAWSELTRATRKRA
ncbi:hypothetical protein [Streptomyces sp. NPDC057702]|uniref:hypothetical protein n=1 Tax=unclassified Streptomyces TaxID=2593676 RepID=UPI0036742ADF